jgi:hypothetical protein
MFQVLIEQGKLRDLLTVIMLDQVLDFVDFFVDRKKDVFFT